LTAEEGVGESDQRPLSDANKCAFDTADNPLASGGLS